MNIEKLWDKYKDIIPYGALWRSSTLVNIVSYWTLRIRLVYRLW